MGQRGAHLRAVMLLKSEAREILSVANGVSKDQAFSVSHVVRSKNVPFSLQTSIFKEFEVGCEQPHGFRLETWKHTKGDLAALSQALPFEGFLTVWVAALSMLMKPQLANNRIMNQAVALKLHGFIMLPMDSASYG